MGAACQSTVAIGRIQIPRRKKPRKGFWHLLKSKREGTVMGNLNVAAWWRGGCCSSKPPGRTSSEAEHVFPIGTCTQTNTHVPHIHTHARGWLRRSAQTDALSTHKTTNNTSVLILLPSLAGQSEGLLVGNICIHTTQLGTTFAALEQPLPTAAWWDGPRKKEG